MHSICALEHMPSTTAVYARMASDDDFGTRIACARAAQQDFEADNIVKMADDADGEDWQVVKLRIWARQWRAAKLAPKKYGDKIDVTSGNEPLAKDETAVAVRAAALVAQALQRGDEPS